MIARPILASVLAALVLVGCTRAPQPPASRPCLASTVLPADAPAHGIPVEQTPAGHCLADRAEAGDIDAALQLGDFYRELPGTLPLIDRKGHELHWYRLAADRGSPPGAWQAARLIDNDRDRQVPNDALAYVITALKGGIPDAGDYLVDQWQDGRIDPGKLWSLRRWLNQPGALPADQRADIIAGLNAPTDELEYE